MKVENITLSDDNKVLYLSILSDNGKKYEKNKDVILTDILSNYNSHKDTLELIKVSVDIENDDVNVLMRDLDSLCGCKIKLNEGE